MALDAHAHPPVRRFEVSTADERVEADLLEGTVTRRGEVEHHGCGPDDTYRRAHEAALAGRRDRLCSVADALDVVRLIEAAERAAASGRRQTP